MDHDDSLTVRQINFIRLEFLFCRRSAKHRRERSDQLAGVFSCNDQRKWQLADQREAAKRQRFRILLRIRYTCFCFLGVIVAILFVHCFPMVSQLLCELRAVVLGVLFVESFRILRFIDPFANGQ